MSEEKDSTKDTKAEEPSVFAKVAQTIAGDNKLLGTILKIILSPLGLVAALCGIGYLFWKNSTLKSKIAELERELQTSKLIVKELEGEIKSLSGTQQQKGSYADSENTCMDSSSDLGYVTRNRRKRNNNNIHLD